MRIKRFIHKKRPRSQRSRKVDPRADDLLLDMALARIAAPVAGMRTH